MIPYRDISLEKHKFNWETCLECNLRNRFICRRIFKSNEIEPILKKKKIRIFYFEINDKNYISEALAKIVNNFLKNGEWDAIPLMKNGCCLCKCNQDNCINPRLKTRRQICICPKLFGIDLDLGDNEGALLIRREG
jgi:hypothetical protein